MADRKFFRHTSLPLMTTLNHYHQESRWLFGAERFLFDFRTGKNKNPFCRVSGSPGGFVPAIMLALVLFAPLPAEAQQFYWTGNTSTDWTTGSNWQGGAAPSSNATSPPPRACRLLPEAHEDAAALLKMGHARTMPLPYSQFALYF